MHENNEENGRKLGDENKRRDLEGSGGTLSCVVEDITHNEEQNIEKRISEIKMDEEVKLEAKAVKVNISRFPEHLWNNSIIIKLSKHWKVRNKSHSKINFNNPEAKQNFK